jgi:hypothetical protein
MVQYVYNIVKIYNDKVKDFLLMQWIGVFSIYIAPLEEKCHNSKGVIFQEKLSKVLKCYNFL